MRWSWFFRRTQLPPLPQLAAVPRSIRCPNFAAPETLAGTSGFTDRLDAVSMAFAPPAHYLPESTAPPVLEDRQLNRTAAIAAQLLALLRLRQSPRPPPGAGLEPLRWPSHRWSECHQPAAHVCQLYRSPKKWKTRRACSLIAPRDLKYLVSMTYDDSAKPDPPMANPAAGPPPPQ